MNLALVLAEGTGRRLSAIRHLRWDDIDLEHGTIRWRAEADKKRAERHAKLPKLKGGSTYLSRTSPRPEDGRTWKRCWSAISSRTTRRSRR
jgi:integrase